MLHRGRPQVVRSSTSLSICAERQERANRLGLFMTKELHEAKEVCREKVKRLADECRRGNRRFRDIEFDLIEDTDRCLYGLERKRAYSPLEARRVSQIFKEPRFIIEGATAGDIAQGDLENCWFLSALAVVASKNLIEEICVARDEDVGIYGFIFWRDSGWVNVIIDDLLFTKIPKWESLTPREQMIYHNRREAYNLWSRKGSKTLYFARSQTENETWVPLIEKAYAKLHGDYASLEAGFTSEAVEDLTGAVSTLIYVQDILNRQKFWEEELMHANNDRLFACFIPTPPATSVTEPALMYPTNGLIVGHAYSIIKVAEFANKKFLRIRNPWGETEWTGPWSDGSGEWDEATRNEARTKLDYNFGVKHKGEFVMEYDDFLETYEVVEKCRLFVKEGWKLSSQWLQVHAGHFPREWNYGDVSFTIDISEPTEAVIVLAQLDSRYFRDLASPYRWSLDFQLYKHNSSIPLASSIHSSLWDRSVKAEIKLLEPGSYVVHVRLDRALKPGRSKDETDEESRAWDNRKLSRKKVERALSMAIAANVDPLTIPLSLDMFAGRSLSEVEEEALEIITNRKRPGKTSKRGNRILDGGRMNQSPERDGHETLKPTIVRESPEEDGSDGDQQHISRYNTALSSSGLLSPGDRPASSCSGSEATNSAKKSDISLSQPHTAHHLNCKMCNRTISGVHFYCIHVKCTGFGICDNCHKYCHQSHPEDHKFLQFENLEDSAPMRDQPDVSLSQGNSIVIGLRVYTQQHAARIAGQLRHGDIIRQSLPPEKPQ